MEEMRAARDLLERHRDRLYRQHEDLVEQPISEINPEDRTAAAQHRAYLQALDFSILIVNSALENEEASARCAELERQAARHDKAGKEVEK